MTTVLPLYENILILRVESFTLKYTEMFSGKDQGICTFLSNGSAKVCMCEERKTERSNDMAKGANC